MMAGISNYLAQEFLNAIFHAQAFSVATCYVQLHVGDPGSDCTANPAVNTERQALDQVAVTGTTFTSANDLVWSNVPQGEVYTYISIWDSSTGGNALWSGPLSTSKRVNAGDSFTLNATSLTVSMA